MLKEKLKRLREGDQVPTQEVTIEEVMSDPCFALGVTDVRSGRGYRASYDTWTRANDQWSYDRGRLWATVAPKSIPLKRDGRITMDAIRVFKHHQYEII